MRDDSRTPTAGDIKGGAVGDWLVTGWFTPNYRPLAERFAVNLAEHSIPYHLWAKPSSERGWNTWRKPSVVLETMERYPGKTIVLMDVDCSVHGDLSPMVVSISGDIGISINARRVRLLWPPHRRTTIKASSRVIVFRPSESARAFAEEWARQCEHTHYAGDEVALLQAYLVRPDISYRHLNKGSLIQHDSAHQHQQRRTVRGALKAIERRYFRSGRSQAAKRAWQQT